MDLQELEAEEAAALPRTNGELVFSAPWESRSFSIALSLAESGYFTLDDFRKYLIVAIEQRESTPSDDPFHYYECWQTALESIVADVDLVNAGAVEERAEAYASRPAGHDHQHADGTSHRH